MRLLNTSTLKLKEFIGEYIPRYAILSHRWGENEITFQDLENIKDNETMKSKSWAKIRGCCAQAAKDNIEWVWVDTCCIDKSSSAELSEAINSMFQWYRGAWVCYAYLSDVYLITTKFQSPPTDVTACFASHVPNIAETHPHSIQIFRQSNWFTRCWTLQELLAPTKLEFFNLEWEPMGSKESLANEISIATGITLGFLDSFQHASIAQKMSWASRRRSTRIEDEAYSLMGLFGVTMPPLYGEGKKAFERLQLEILKISDDESIFAWRDRNIRSGALLAHSTSCFKDSQSFYRINSKHNGRPYFMTNKGLQLELHLRYQADPTSLMRKRVYTYLDMIQALWTSSDADQTANMAGAFLAPLQCEWAVKLHPTPCILLRQVQGNQFARIAPGRLFPMPTWQLHDLEVSTPRKTVYVKQIDESIPTFSGPYNFSIVTSILHEHGFKLSHRYTSKPRCQWEANINDVERLVVDKISSAGISASLEFSRRPLLIPERFEIVISIQDHIPRVDIREAGALDSLRALIEPLVAVSDVKRTGVFEYLHSATDLKLTTGETVEVELHSQENNFPVLGGYSQGNLLHKSQDVQVEPLQPVAVPTKWVNQPSGITDYAVRIKVLDSVPDPFQRDQNLSKD